MEGRMMAATIKSPRNMVLEEVKIPRPKVDEVLVKVLFTGVCGSDLRTWEGTHWWIENWPLPPGGYGHEGVGEVVEVGDKVKGIRVGDLVGNIGRTCFAQYTVAKNTHVITGQDPEAMCLAGPISNALNIVDLTEAKPGETVVILGQGSIGLIATQLLTRIGVTVFATDVVERRIRQSERYGAKAFDARERDWMDRIVREAGDVKAVVECSGSDGTLIPACHIVGTAGTIVVYGCQGEMRLPYRPLRRKGVRIEFGTASVNMRKGIDFTDEAYSVLLEKKIDAKGMISAKVPLTQLPWVMAHYDREKWSKVLVQPNPMPSHETI